MAKKVIIVGSGFAGLSAACCLAQAGYSVLVLEKNEAAGGRARTFEEQGFQFDMGPSWYWMPDVFEQFFARFGKKVSDYYELVRLDPSYVIHFGKGDTMQVPADRENLNALFERYEPGSSVRLAQFLKEAEYKYRVGMNEFVFKPGNGLAEFMDWRVVKSAFGLQMLTSMAKHVNGLFQNEHLRQLLKFPVLFLGATPEKTPAMYSLMNHADLVLGTWYPMGGMNKIVQGMVSLAEELGVRFQYNEAVTAIKTFGSKATQVLTTLGAYEADAVVAGADYHHVEQTLLPQAQRRYSEQYWQSRTMAPSSFLYYLGLNKTVKGLLHHNLFFDADFNQHAAEIYTTPKLPTAPLFYACATSKTDPTAAPLGGENLFLLIPAAPDLDDSEAVRAHYLQLVLRRMESQLGEEIASSIVYQRTYAHRDFISDYNAFRGNAYGLANTLRQTAFLKPAMRSKKVGNLFYTGQLTVPGPGVPPSLISGQVVAKELAKVIKP